jgi:hypothetical protein
MGPIPLVVGSARSGHPVRHLARASNQSGISASGPIAAVKRGAKNPSLAFMLPSPSVASFVTHVLSTPEAFVGIWLI